MPVYPRTVVPTIGVDAAGLRPSTPPAARSAAAIRPLLTFALKGLPPFRWELSDGRKTPGFR